MEAIPIEQLLAKQQKEIHRVAAKHGVTRLRVFGSAARGESGPQSDIDFLIETGSTTSPWFPAGLILELEQLLGRRVEVVTEQALHPAIRETVLREARPL